MNSNFVYSIIIATICSLSLFGVATADDAKSVLEPIAAESVASRGELLYSTHCIACHSVKVHWRDKKLVTDQASLREEIRRWQEFLKLGWHGDDIDEVAQYLNARYYHYSPVPE